MPFEDRFDDIASLIHDTAIEVFEQYKDFFALPQIDRLDWVTSAGAIQQQIWQKIVEADLVFCDITGYNPNVMLESGVWLGTIYGVCGLHRCVDGFSRTSSHERRFSSPRNPR